MITQDLLNYIKSQLQQGVSENILRNTLRENNWSEQDINQAFGSLGQAPIPAAANPLSASSLKTATSEKTKTIVTIVLLFLFPLIGMIVMWFWPKWPRWLKIIITLPSVLITLGVIAAALLSAINPKAQIEKAKCVKQCESSGGGEACTSACTEISGSTPTPTSTFIID